MSSGLTADTQVTLAVHPPVVTSGRRPFTRTVVQADLHRDTQVGQDLRLEVVAEGLETGDQLEALRSIACPLGQGHHSSRPRTAGDAVRLVLTGRRPAPAMLVPA